MIKFLTVRIDEELKRLDKIKKLRDAKKKSARNRPRSPGGGRARGCAGERRQSAPA